MDELIPIFPLEIVVYPGDALNLHIFEPRYQQLIDDCEPAKMPFGIPSVVDRKIAGLGTLVKLTGVSNLQPDGQRDIKTRGLRIFRIVELIKPYPGKLYSAAVVQYPEIDDAGDAGLRRQVVASVKKLHRLLNVEKDFSKTEAELTSYDLAHHVGLSVAQEYALLKLFSEDERLAYLQKHLETALPVVAGMESLKEKIQFNGHFKNLPGFEV
ncbi:MAG TPA: LON peptidase substrate-binding domain-containing protein [Candidatus Acidoferrales bacterium]|jgi:Lon protease-like protein|nr:LON peptidase substrate-binding domain-containing protein [Candidatus Acidoferrales bacterium]